MGFDPSVSIALPDAGRARDWRERAARWVGLGMTVAILVVVMSQFDNGERERILTMLPHSPAFWLIFLCGYVLTPICEWVIYRRLWNLPVGGLVPLFSKYVANELVLGYSGEAHFYLWARRHAGVTGSPFGAIKDVAVLSALAGNLMTLAMMVVMAPMIAPIIQGPIAKSFAISVGVIVISSLALFGLRKTLFSLSGEALRSILGVHVLRIVLTVAFSAMAWHLLLPGIGMHWWLVLATLRMMLSRVPLLPGKDIVFAGLVMLLLGKQAGVTSAMAFMASLTVAVHMVVGVVTSGLMLIDERKAAAAG